MVETAIGQVCRFDVQRSYMGLLPGYEQEACAYDFDPRCLPSQSENQVAQPGIARLLDRYTDHEVLDSRVNYSLQIDTTFNIASHGGSLATLQLCSGVSSAKSELAACLLFRDGDPFVSGTN